MMQNIYEYARWWREQSFAGDKGGSFDIELYLEILKCKAKCIDSNTISMTSSSINGASSPLPCASGKKENCNDQETA